MTHPIQSIYKDKQGTLRFKENAIVSYLLDKGGMDMNHLAVQDFTNEDREQFAQLIGYSLCGFGELGYTSNDTYAAAELMASKGKTEEKARIETLTKQLKKLRGYIKLMATEVFQIHPDDLVP